MKNFALADNGSAIIDGVSVSPCGVTTLEALCFFGGPVTIGELMEENEGLFIYSSWHTHLCHLVAKNLAERSVQSQKGRRKIRVRWEATKKAREFIELMQRSV